jgi:hypothetical protein
MTGPVMMEMSATEQRPVIRNSTVKRVIHWFVTMVICAQPTVVIRQPDVFIHRWNALRVSPVILQTGNVCRQVVTHPIAMMEIPVRRMSVMWIRVKIRPMMPSVTMVISVTAWRPVMQ